MTVITLISQNKVRFQVLPSSDTVAEMYEASIEVLICKFSNDSCGVCFTLDVASSWIKEIRNFQLLCCGNETEYCSQHKMVIF